MKDTVALEIRKGKMTSGLNGVIDSSSLFRSSFHES